MTLIGRPVMWSTVLWIMIFLFTLNTYNEASLLARMTPLVGLFVLLSILLLLLATNAKETKTMLWLGSWALVLDIGVMLSTLGILNDTFFTIYMCVFTTLASLVWCVVGNADRVSEPGWHWYVWCLTITLSFCIVSNLMIIETLPVNIFVGVLFILLHLVYTRHALRGLQPNRHRCRHLWRIWSTVLVILSLLTANVLFQEEILTKTSWHEYIIIVECIILAMLWVDATISSIGFTSDGIYDQVNIDEKYDDTLGV